MHLEVLSFDLQLLPSVVGIRKKEAGASLTAILDDDRDRGDPVVGFALQASERSGVFIAVASGLPTIAEKARIELMA